MTYIIFVFSFAATLLTLALMRATRSLRAGVFYRFFLCFFTSVYLVATAAAIALDVSGVTP